MKKKSHIIFGFIFVLFLILIFGYLEFNSITFNLSTLSLILVITFFYSIFPDIDHKSGTITWIFIGLSIIGILGGILGLLFNFGNPVIILIYSLLLLFFVFIASNFLEHRGFMHSITAGVIMSIPLWFLFHSISLCLIAYAAWHSHLIGDGFLFKIK